jgi:hypothetical protein
VLTIAASRYTWRPPPVVASELPAGYSLSLECLCPGDGTRRFVPVLGLGGFIAQAAMGGRVLLARDPAHSAVHVSSYRLMSLFYHQACQAQEHYDREFVHETDLYVARAGRARGDADHVLPPTLGLDAGGRGAPWTPADVISHGRRAAAEAGDPNPTTAKCIRLGLATAARRDPVDPRVDSPDQALSRVRQALFDLRSASRVVDESLVETVLEKLGPALHTHLQDDTAAFDRWFFREIANLVRLASKKKGGGRRLTSAQVRDVLLDLGFRAFTYVGQCVGAQMHAFARALPDPLTADESRVLATVYQAQPHFGGLPLVLIRDRLKFLGEALTDAWARPGDSQVIGTLLRLLDYYAEMASKRRDADRNYKRHGRHRNNEGKPARILELVPDGHAAVAAQEDFFQEIAAALREQNRASCSCRTGSRWRAALVEHLTTGDLVVFDDVCETCDSRIRVECRRDEYERVGRTMINNR